MTASFPPVPVADWEAQILADLKGADYEKKLVWKTPENLAFRPYYTSETAPPPVAIDGITPWQAAEPVPDIDAAAFQDQGANTVEELAFALSSAVAHLPQPLTIQFAAGPLFLLEIAKYRAMRALWASVCEAAGTNIPLHMHAVTAMWNKSALDPHNNLLRATAEALAAVIGGANTVSVRPDGIDPHLARNILHILREEAHLDTTTDPAAGSWHIEALTTMLACEAWKRFQQIEAAGGFLTFEQSGALAQALAISRKAKEAAYATRRATLVGVNTYPNPAEPVHEAPPTTWRAAGIFERIRLRTARHIGRSWTRVQDRDFERETNELQIMAQAGPYRMF
jgi:methylmalonyl-CoA mutase